MFEEKSKTLMRKLLLNKSSLNYNEEIGNLKTVINFKRVNIMKKILITFILTFAVITSLLAEGTLISAVLITRHGDRTPFDNIVNANYQWGTDLSELTPIGMHQEFMLGSTLRKHYIEDLKFLDGQYKANTIYTLSSNSNRTILSAECLLMGLYPPGTTGPEIAKEEPALPGRIQVIPVRSLPDSSYMILTPYQIYLKILGKYVYNSKEWTDKQNELKPKFEVWSKTLGNKIETLGDVLTIGDVLIVAKQHKLPMPEGLGDKDITEILQATSWGLAQQFKSETVSYLMGGELVNTIIKNLKESAEGKYKYKLTYYSGHDITILPVMSLLGSPLKESPGYAANVIIELYKENASQFYVKVLYNGDYVKLPIMNGKDSCSLSDIEAHISKLNEKCKNVKLP